MIFLYQNVNLCIMIHVPQLFYLMREQSTLSNLTTHKKINYKSTITYFVHNLVSNSNINYFKEAGEILLNT